MNIKYLKSELLNELSVDAIVLDRGDRLEISFCNVEIDLYYKLSSHYAQTLYHPEEKNYDAIRFTCNVSNNLVLSDFDIFIESELNTFG